MFYFSCLSKPLYGRYRLSRASQAIDLEEIYRVVSKILNFMPCGLVLDRFCVYHKTFIASASNFYRFVIEILSKFYCGSLNAKVRCHSVPLSSPVPRANWSLIQIVFRGFRAYFLMGAGGSRKKCSGPVFGQYLKYINRLGALWKILATRPAP